MRLLIDFVPIALFFAAYQWRGIYTATLVLMVATVVQMGLIHAIERRLQAVHKVTLLLVLVFGTLTLLLQDERFIKWKPTVFYGAVALGLAAALWGWKKNVLQLLLGSQLHLPAAVWSRLAIAWIGYCLFMAATNAYVAGYFSTDTWVNFKLWGYVFPVLFLLGQGVYIARHLRDNAQ